MNGGLVVQPEERGTFSGTGLLDSGISTAQAIHDGDWVAAALSGVGLAFDAVATYSDPLGSLISAGIGWVIDHLDPIKGWFDDLAGNPEAVSAFAGTWLNVANSLSACNTTYVMGANQKLGEMTGPNVTRYRQHVEEMSDKLSFVSGASRAMSVGTDVAAGLVQFVHGLLRDALSDIAGSILSYIGELVFTLGAATPLVIHQATTRVSALAAEVGPKIKGLKDSVTDLDSLVSELRDILNDIPRFLGDRFSVPNHPGLRWSNVLNNPREVLGNLTVGEAVRILNLDDAYAHILSGNPRLWARVVDDAVREGLGSNGADAAKALKEALERQLHGHG